MTAEIEQRVIAVLNAHPDKFTREACDDFVARYGGDDDLADAVGCDDVGWWLLTGMCGGCGTSTCHDGPCGQLGGECDRCKDWWPAS